MTAPSDYASDSAAGFAAGVAARVPLRLEVRGLVKRYGQVVALDGASLEARPGEVMALMGDNGAGKSTLIKCVSGLQSHDAGTVLMDGQPFDASSPLGVLAAGVETVYQDLAVVDPMSVVGNIFLGREVAAQGLLGRLLGVCDDRGMKAAARGALDRIGARIPDLGVPVSELSGGQRQAVSIARATLWGHRLVILDEPAAALGVEQSKHVLEMILNLKSQGVTVLLISHNIQHVWEVADRVTVLRLGKTVGVRDVTSSTHDEIVGLITGATASVHGAD